MLPWLKQQLKRKSGDFGSIWQFPIRTFYLFLAQIVHLTYGSHQTWVKDKEFVIYSASNLKLELNTQTSQEIDYCLYIDCTVDAPKF